MTKQLAPVTRTAFVRCTVERAFVAFTDEMSQWWPLASHSVFLDGAVSVTFEDGHVIERSAAGETNEWGKVLTWDPPHSFSMTWHPGRIKEPDTVLTLRFRSEDGGTRVDLEHTGWETFGERADELRASYDDAAGWNTVFATFTAMLDAA